MICVCGHERDEHCNCGADCFAHGPLERQEDGRQEYAWTCKCSGFAEPLQWRKTAPTDKSQEGA